MEIVELLQPELKTLNFTCSLKSTDYRIVKQENIIDDNDNLITGIYYTSCFKYVICCHRGNSMLDYTKFAANEETANTLYAQMLQEIEGDLNI